MLAVTTTVAAALKNGCDAWHLRLDKFSFQRDGGATAKTDTLQELIRSYNDHATAHLDGACSSLQRFLEVLQQHHGKRCAVIKLVAESRLLVHLGRAGVLENVGLCADRTTGLPMVPGTALKGVLSTWACWEANQQSDGSFNEGAAFIQTRKEFPNHLARRVFGDDSADGSKHSGDVIFVGGFPVTPPKLGLDIVNPHHEADGSDRTRLTPSSFLCVEPGTQWRFAFYVRPGALDQESLIQTTTRWLTEALTQIGIGAKTAAGYGRFRKPTAQDEAAAKVAAEQAAEAKQAAAEAERKRQEQAKQKAEADRILKADYTEASFKNVLRLAENKGEWNQLQEELKRLRKPENANWLQKFKDSTKGKDWRELRKQDWYPK